MTQVITYLSALVALGMASAAMAELTSMEGINPPGARGPWVYRINDTGDVVDYRDGIAGVGKKSWEQLILDVEHLQQQGNYVEAEKVLLRALKEAERFAPGDLRLAGTLYTLGSFYLDAARFAEAERFYLRSISAWEQSAGADHPSLSRPLSSLLVLYLEKRMYGKAERLRRRCLAILGSLELNDRDAARLLQHLATLHYGQRKYSEAEPLYRQALAKLEKAFGPEDWEVGLVLSNLAVLCHRTDRYAEANSYLQRALVIWEKAMGPNHPDVVRGLSNLAGFYYVEGRYMEAEPVFRRALALAENAFGPENPLVGSILADYAVLLRKTKRKAEARSFERRAQAIREGYAHEDLGRYVIDAADLLPRRDNRSDKR